MLDTLHTTQIIHDTLYIKGAEGIDILYKTDAFYNSAWTKLLIFWTVLAIIIPSVIAWFQNRSLKISTADVKKELEEKMQEYKEQMKRDFELYQKNTKEEIEAILKAKIAVFAKSMYKGLKKSEGSIQYLQANSFFNNKDYPQAFRIYVYAAKKWLAAEDYSNLQNALNSINLKCLPNLTLKAVKDIKTNYGTDLEQLLNEIQKSDAKGHFKNTIIAIKISLGNLK